ncbi:HD domain-containing phosphohydrolase [Candidatus Oscillochloris fontis]|uniref:HD domain-containing phosphohydrolase n=1 Tax=Candidatus Oscillochloris fontis TaxID=2496868 RepID=UPI00101C8BD3|nr:HD domain-containing phosphohydrolase [Candidatus Oscillochloris fontis]
MTTPIVLITDDNPLGREALEDLLYGQGYELAFAVDGPTALLQAERLMPDLILLHVMMPGMDGFEVCRHLRANPRLAEVPVVIITALDDSGSRLKGLEAGADDFISKPFNRSELRARVRTITRLNRYRNLISERTALQQAHGDLIASYDATIEGWVHALDLRDKETEGHSLRVTELTVRLANMVGISEPALTHIRRGALLHDVGKIGIPDAILLKPGKLTATEWEIMRKHPQYAYEMLAPIAYLQPALDIPYSHHEKWDGTGYPQGLAGESIPLPARLFAVVDVWDALRSDRPYRAGWSVEETLAHIQAQSGSHFDPAVVPVFMEMVQQHLLPHM